MNKNVLFRIQAEGRGTSFAPIVTGNVSVDKYYTLALIDSTETFVLWYVRDVHGFDLVRGYDAYCSDSGNTVYEWNVPLRETKGKLLLLENVQAPTTRRYECIPKNSILTDTVLTYERDDEDKENTLCSPSWYSTLSSLSRSSIY